MFKELLPEDGKSQSYELNGTYVGVFRGVSERKRKTFETRNSDTPEYEDCFIFEFEVNDPDLSDSLRVAKWVNKPKRLMHPSNGKSSNLYKVLASLYGVSVMTDEQLENAEEFIEQAIDREYMLTLVTKPNGWIDIVHIAPARKARKRSTDEEIPF